MVEVKDFAAVVRMAGSTEPMSVVELCSPGTLRICAHVENVLC